MRLFAKDPSVPKTGAPHYCHKAAISMPYRFLAGFVFARSLPILGGENADGAKKNRSASRFKGSSAFWKSSGNSPGKRFSPGCSKRRVWKNGKIGSGFFRFGIHGSDGKGAAWSFEDPSLCFKVPTAPPNQSPGNLSGTLAKQGRCFFVLEGDGDLTY
jgi:hypothetical protein